ARQLCDFWLGATISSANLWQCGQMPPAVWAALCAPVQIAASTCFPRKIMTEAQPYVAKMKKDEIIHEFYKQCGYEIAGWFQVTARKPKRVNSLEDIVDGMLASDAWVQLIVCHGNPDRGLLIPLTKDSKFNSTGAVIDDLAVLAENSGSLEYAGNSYEGRL